MSRGGRWRIGLSLAVLATAVRFAWTLAVPTIPVGDFATYRESAIYLAEFGHFDSGFVYMPGLVLLLAALHQLGGDVFAAKMVGVVMGGLAAAPIFVVTAHLSEPRPEATRQSNAHGARSPHRSSQVRDAGAFIAGLAYALWPAGIAMSSVIGTDVPTAAVIVWALSLLCALGGRRPVLAAVTFGATMGIAAYFRAVALPLTVLSAGFWWARRERFPVIVRRTALAVAVTFLVLLPWGLRNRARSGELYFTDSHGGITALMGNDPNTEGTHSRSLAITFRELTGRTFLMEPHRQTDRTAYQLAKQYMRFDPAWTIGMIALRIQRLFAPERGLLYWSIYRPGVVPSTTVAWFNQHRVGITRLADWFYLLLVLGWCAGLGFAVSERSWAVLVPAPFALAMAVTYALFVAEPRYRITSEVVMFPLAGFGLARLYGSRGALGAKIREACVAVGARLQRAGTRETQGAAPYLRATATAGTTTDLRGLAATLFVTAGLVVAGYGLVRGGRILRDRHRWAATVWQVDGRPQLAAWRGRPAPGAPSPVRAAAPAAAIRLPPGQDHVDVEIVLPGSQVDPGPRLLEATLSWRGTGASEFAFVLGDVRAVGGAPRLTGMVGWRERQTLLRARLERTPGEGVTPLNNVEVEISDVRVSSPDRP